jgi:hypothetical protein
VHIVDADQDRGCQRRFLEQRLQFLEQPVALLGQKMQPVPRGRIDQRLAAVEQRGDQAAHRHHLVTCLHGSEARPDPGPAGHRCGLGQQPRLAETRPALYEQDGTAALPGGGQPFADHDELPVAPSQRGSRHWGTYKLRDTATLSRSVPTVTSRCEAAHASKILRRHLDRRECRPSGEPSVGQFTNGMFVSCLASARGRTL